MCPRTSRYDAERRPAIPGRTPPSTRRGLRAGLLRTASRRKDKAPGSSLRASRRWPAGASRPPGSRRHGSSRCTQAAKRPRPHAPRARKPRTADFQDTAADGDRVDGLLRSDELEDHLGSCRRPELRRRPRLFHDLSLLGEAPVLASKALERFALLAAQTVALALIDIELGGPVAATGVRHPGRAPARGSSGRRDEVTGTPSRLNTTASRMALRIAVERSRAIRSSLRVRSAAARAVAASRSRTRRSTALFTAR
jgi:hypothetical protein